MESGLPASELPASGLPASGLPASGLRQSNRARETQAFGKYIKAITDSAFSYALLLDSGGRILYYSDSLIHLAVIKEEDEFIGMPILEAYEILFTDRDFIVEATRRFSRIMAGENEFYEDDIVTWPNGEKHIYRITYKRISTIDDHFDGIVIFSRDITDIRLEEAGLRLNDLLHSTALPCMIWDENGDAIEYNDEFAQTFGIPDDLPPGKYNDIFPIIQPLRQGEGVVTEDQRRMVAREALEKGFSQSNVWLKQKDGEPYYCTVNITRIELPFGFRLVAYYCDRTDTVLKEAKAKKADERMKIMLDAAPLGCLFLGDEMSILDCNHELLRILDAPYKQMVLDDFFRFSPEYQPDGQQSVAKASEYVEQTYRTGGVHFDWVHQDFHGEPVPAEVTLACIKHENEFALVCYIRDLREHLKMVAETNEAVERAKMMVKSVAILESVDSLISVTDLDYNLIYMNQYLADAFNIDRDDCIGKKCYKAMRNMDEPCTICRLPELLPDKDSLPTKIDDYLWDEALGMWTESKASIIRWVDDSLVLFHSINDRSVKKAYEDELLKAMEASIAASASKSAFLANMSHEVRTPMNSIIGFAELALDCVIAPKTEDYLNKILDSAKWLLHIINDILDISKIESGRLELENAPFDLQGIITRCQSVISPAANEKGLELCFDAEPLEGIRLLGDSVRLYQVLMNLLSNAVKFTSTGTVSFSSVVKEAGEHSVTIRFEVKDSGIGMTDEQISRIFEPFMQADSGTTRNYGGTGLGLAITKNFVDLMGSSLIVESTYGAGSTFSFEITFQAVEAPSDIPGYGEANMVKKPYFDGLILICEDNPLNQQVICEHLSRVGLQTVVAENGRTGVDLVKKRKKSGEKAFDLIFMDMYMPVMNGAEAAQLIAKLDTGVPIVAMTANIMTDELENYKNSGMADYVGKPFTSQELWRCLLKFLKPLRFESADGAWAPDEDERARDADLQRKLETNFASGNQSKFEEIAKAIDADDISLAHRLAHTLKSNAGLIGKTALQEAAAATEALLKDGKTPPAELLGELKVQLEAALGALTVSAAGLPDRTAQGALGPGQAEALLRKLEPMLENRSPECLDLLDEIRLIPGAGALARQIEDFDFKLAARTLSGLIGGQVQSNG